MKTLNLGNVFVALTLLLGIILVINIFLTFNLNQELKKNAEALQEKLKPAKIELTVIKNSKCADCFDISTVVSHVKNANANITKETTLEFDSQKAKEFIRKYKIEKIPAIIVTGEIEKVNLQGLDKKENALLLTRLNPPYTNAATGKIEGRVILYSLKDLSCEKCNNLSAFINQIKSSGIKINEEKIIDITTNEGKELIAKYNIGFAPTIILSKDASAYEIIQKAWPQVGSKESDGSYVLRQVNPPYINVTTKKLRGIVNIVYLSDKVCTECYNVNVHKEILTSPQSFAMVFDKEETVDMEDAKGKELIAKYNITQVPTIIISDEAAAYPSTAALRQFFSVEKDGSYIFRRPSVLGSYKDLTTGNIVKPVQQNQEATA